jgi:hypothetical protein
MARRAGDARCRRLRRCSRDARVVRCAGERARRQVPSCGYSQTIPAVSNCAMAELLSSKPSRACSRSGADRHPAAILAEPPTRSSVGDLSRDDRALTATARLPNARGKAGDSAGWREYCATPSS